MKCVFVILTLGESNNTQSYIIWDYYYLWHILCSSLCLDPVVSARSGRGKTATATTSTTTTAITTPTTYVPLLAIFHI